MINKNKNIWASKQTFLATLYILGIIHWLAFFMLVYPEEGDKTFIKTILGDISLLSKYIDDISSLFKYSTFTASEWFHDLNYLNVMKEAIQTWTMPYHVSNLGLMYTIDERFLGGGVYITSPQILLLYFVSPMTFVIINHLIMYSVGFWGCLLLKEKYNLGVISFSFLYLMFNYNGSHFWVSCPNYMFIMMLYLQYYVGIDWSVSIRILEETVKKKGHSFSISDAVTCVKYFIVK